MNSHAPFRKTILAVVPAAILAAGCVGAGASGRGVDPAEAEAVSAEQGRLLVAIGLAVGKNLEVFRLSPEEFERVLEGIRSARAGTATVSLEEYAARVPEFARSRTPAQFEGKGVAAAAPATAADLANVLQAIGLVVDRNLDTFRLSAAEFERVVDGLRSARAGDAPVKLEDYQAQISALARARMSVGAAARKEADAKVVAQLASEPGAQRSASGLVYISQVMGAGKSPRATDTVTVHYRGTLTDGREFDSSYKRGQPSSFRLDGVIPCWTEGVQRMRVGGKAKLVCPPSIAYGDDGRPPVILGGATLLFEVELQGVR